MESFRILVVDDEKAARYGMVKALRPEGHSISEAEDALSAFTLMEQAPFDIIITDLSMPGLNGIDFLRKIKQKGLSVLVILITAHGSEKIAVEAMKAGAFDYIRKPYEIDELRLITANAVNQVRLQRENASLRDALNSARGYGKIIGQSPRMLKIYDVLEKVSATDATVFISGESGTGKELVANTVHGLSRRKSHPFISVNCAAIPKDLIESELFGHEKGAFTGAVNRRLGKFELAHKGTLFLDEIGDMDPKTQAKVLRVLQDRKFERIGGRETIEVDVRIISATHKDLFQLIRKSAFREDLYFRLRVIDIDLPPLRERKGDIPLLARHFLQVLNQKHRTEISSIEPGAMEALMDYNWPGNVRELINVLERSVVLAVEDRITPESLPADILNKNSQSRFGIDAALENGTLNFRDAKLKIVRTFERDFIVKALQKYNFNITQTADKIGMKRQYLQQKIKDLEIEIDDLRED